MLTANRSFSEGGNPRPPWASAIQKRTSAIQKQASLTAIQNMSLRHTVHEPLPYRTIYFLFFKPCFMCIIKDFKKNFRCSGEIELLKTIIIYWLAWIVHLIFIMWFISFTQIKTFFQRKERYLENKFLWIFLFKIIFSLGRYPFLYK